MMRFILLTVLTMNASHAFAENKFCATGDFIAESCDGSMLSEKCIKRKVDFVQYQNQELFVMKGCYRTVDAYDAETAVCEFHNPSGLASWPISLLKDQTGPNFLSINNEGKVQTVRVKDIRFDCVKN